MIEAKARVPKMHEASLPSLMVPYGADQTLYVVIDRVNGAKEIRIERTDLENTIRELIAGCFSDPVRVTSFNTLEHWTKDISAEIAAEIQARCDIECIGLPEHIKDFVDNHTCCAPAPGLSIVPWGTPVRTRASRPG